MCWWWWWFGHCFCFEGVLFCSVFETGSLYISPDCPGTYYVEKADLKLTELHLPLLYVLGLKVYSTTPGFVEFCCFVLMLFVLSRFYSVVYTVLRAHYVVQAGPKLTSSSLPQLSSAGITGPTVPNKKRVFWLVEHIFPWNLFSNFSKVKTGLFKLYPISKNKKAENKTFLPHFISLSEQVIIVLSSLFNLPEKNVHSYTSTSFKKNKKN